MSDTITLDLSEIKRLAEAATGGPWRVSRHETKTRGLDIMSDSICVAHVHLPAYVEQTRARADAAFIVAANPSAVVALLSRLESAEQERDRLRTVAEATYKLVDEFGCTLDQYNRKGPDYTHKDGTEVFDVSVITDRASLIEETRAALAAYRATLGTKAPTP